MWQKLINNLKPKMEKSLQHFRDEIAKIRSSRFNPVLIEELKIPCYGANLPLKQLAAISSPSPRLIIIQIWDKNLVKEIEKAISEANLGLSCSSDGNVIRATLPSLTQEQRAELVKLVKAKGEEAKVALRNLRREVLDEIEEFKRKGKVSEDDFYRCKDELNKITHNFDQKIEEATESKEKEINKI